MKTKFITLLLAVAANVGTIYSEVINGTCGENLTWSFNTEDSTLTIEGSGVMRFNHGSGWSSTDVPWDMFRSSIKYISLPDGLESIGFFAFSNCIGLTSVTIPNSVTSIEFFAFSNCIGLTSVTIPSSVTSIGSDAFKGVLNVIFTGSATGAPWGAKSVNGYVDGYLTFSDNSKTALLGCSQSVQGEIIIPNSVTSIGEAAFEFCSGLTSVTIPSSVTSIGWGVFYGCTGLISVTIPSSVTSIGEYAFYECDSLSTIMTPALLFNNAMSTFHLYEDQEMPTQISHLTINGGTLTQYAFDQIRVSYRKLEYVDLSATENTEIPGEAFEGCYNLQTLILPTNLERIDYMAMAECVNLESIAIPASVEEIGDRAFEDCRSLQSVTFGGTANLAPGRTNALAAATGQLHKIGNWAFYNAHELQHLDIPEGVTEIGDGAFYGCTYLENLNLPASVQSIGDNTFALCSKLTKITCNAVTPPTIEAKTFYDVKRQIPVYVPDEAVSAYENDTYWQEFDIQGASMMPQGIDNIPFSSGEGRSEALKVLRDGQIFILRGDKTYTLQGQEVK